MPAGKPRYAKAGREDYVFNRPAPAIAALPRATEDLLVAYRIFSPGLGKLADLDEISASVLQGVEDGSCDDLMQGLGVGSSIELRELCKKSYNVYAAEIKRMIAVEEAEANKLAEKLAAREARKQAQEEEREKAIAEKETLTQSDHTATTNKRCADAELTSSCPTKRIRHEICNDLIPEPYWLSKEQAQAALDDMNVCAKNLEATFICLREFYHDTFASDNDPANPTISTSLNRLETQICQDTMWYVEELQKTMEGAPSAELGIKTGLEGEWRRDRFHNATVRGLIERIREFGARLKDTEKEMDESDRLREEFAKENVGCEVVRQMFLQSWAKQLRRVTTTAAHEAKEYVTFRTMEVEWAEKWAEKKKTADEGQGEKDRSSVEVIVIDDSSDSDDSYDSVLDESDVSDEE